MRKSCLLLLLLLSDAPRLGLGLGLFLVDFGLPPLARLLLLLLLLLPEKKSETSVPCYITTESHDMGYF